MRKRKTLWIILLILLFAAICVVTWQWCMQRHKQVMLQRLPGVIFTGEPGGGAFSYALVDPKGGTATDSCVGSYKAVGNTAAVCGSQYGVLECRRNGEIRDISGYPDRLLYTIPTDGAVSYFIYPYYIDKTHLSVIYEGDMYVIDLTANSHQLYIDGVCWYRWNTDRTELFYRQDDVIYRRSYPDGVPEKLYEGDGIVSEDGEYFVYITPSYETVEQKEEQLMVYTGTAFFAYLIPQQRFCVRELATGREWKSPRVKMQDYDISPDGRYVAYVCPTGWYQLGMRVWECQSGIIVDVLHYGAERPIQLEWLND